ncbi:hypothetical protein CC78DRAFT_83942 [Lojkania enalia]|uniref:Uncharacterized protein n=1 Tax=Lojkania enalia TaxID=147567 RepID=A0A9P4K1M3_9PLEO|nr:hypothetical protein CC78DRAFT_83942 [Didymosphaeria enalia]
MDLNEAPNPQDASEAPNPQEFPARQPHSSENRLLGKLTLSLDCELLLKPSPDRPGTFMPRSVDEVAEELHFATLLSVPVLDSIKIKLFHTCGPIEFEEGTCLRALWAFCDWFKEAYAMQGRAVRCEKVARDSRNEDWTDPDATLTVNID